MPPVPARARELSFAALLCAAGAALVFAPLLFGGRSSLAFELDDPRVDVRPWARAASAPLEPRNLVAPDVDMYVLPGWIRMRQVVAAGALPWWDDSQLLGYPIAANLPVPSFSPLVWLASVLPPVDGLDLLLALHTALAAFLAYAAARRLGAGPGAASLAAVGSALAGWMAAHWHQPHLLYTVAWWPGLVLGLELLRQRRELASCLLLSLAGAASIVSGFPWIALAMLAALSALVVLDPELRRPGALVVAGLGMALAVGLAWPALAISGGAYREALRSGEAATAARAGEGLAPGALVGLVLPDAFGSPPDFSLPSAPAPSMEAWLPRRLLAGPDIQDNVVENALYPGLLVLLLVPVALGRAARARRLLLLAALILGACLLWPVLVEALPALRASGAGNVKRSLAILGGTLPLAAALGAQALYERRARLPLVMAGALLVVLGVVPWLAGRVDDPQAAAWSAQLGVQSWRQALVLVAGLAALAAARRWRALQLLPALALFADLVGYAWSFNPFPRQLEPFPRTAVTRALAERDAPGRVATLGTSNLLPASAAAVFGLRSVHGITALSARRTLELLATIEGPLHDPRDPRVVNPFRRVESLSHPLLDLLGVDAVVHADPGLAVATGWTPILESEEEGLGVLERPGAGPRAFLARDVRVVPSPEERLALLGARDFPVRERVLVEEDPGLAFDPAAGHEPVLVLQDSPGEVRLSSKSAYAGLLVLVEAWDPGWSATVDDEPADVLVADHALLAVALPDGPHEVRFRYEPPALSSSLLVSALASLALVALAWILARR